MADDTTAPGVTEAFSKRVRLNFASLSLAYCFGLISYLVWRGAPGNSLHESALSWAFIVAGGVLGGIGFGAVSALMPGAKR